MTNAPTSTVTIEEIVRRWTAPGVRPLFKGELISEGGGYDDDDPPCRCAQGDVLHVAGYSDDALRDMNQGVADRETARILGISVAHSILLRIINDNLSGSPQDVLIAPEKVLGPQARRILNFYRRLDAMTFEELTRATRATQDALNSLHSWAARGVLSANAADVAEAAEISTAFRISRDGRVARYAVYEIIGEIDPLHFLKLFGVNALTDLDKEPPQ